jgi:hypothetical protein
VSIQLDDPGMSVTDTGISHGRSRSRSPVISKNTIVDVGTEHTTMSTPTRRTTTPCRGERAKQKREKRQQREQLRLRKLVTEQAKQEAAEREVGVSTPNSFELQRFRHVKKSLTHVRVDELAQEGLHCWVGLLGYISKSSDEPEGHWVSAGEAGINIITSHQ